MWFFRSTKNIIQLIIKNFNRNSVHLTNKSIITIHMKKIQFALAAIVLSAFTMNAQQDADVVAAKKANAQTSSNTIKKAASDAATEVKTTTTDAVKITPTEELTPDMKAAQEMEKAKAKAKQKAKIDNE